MRRPAQLAVLVAASFMLLIAPAAGAAITYAPCAAGSALQCGSLDVPLDRSGVIPGTVRLAVARKPATTPSSVAVVGLAGGPGQAARPLISDFASLLTPALATRDLLVFDQRGTGGSGPLSCSLGSASLTTAGMRCASSLGAGRGQYTTAASVDDIEALRVAGGYAKLVLFGVSYGTRVALDYAARYPDHVEALVLDSVVLPSGPDTLQRSTFAAMGRVLGELCAGACGGISSNPAGDLASRVRSLARKPLRGLLTSGLGKRQRVYIDRGDLFDIMLGGDINPTLRAELPGALTSAHRGDSAPLIRLAARSEGIVSLRRQASGSDFNDAVFAATLCEEGVFPWDRTASLATRSQQINAYARSLPAGTFSPFDVSTALTAQIVKLCVGWPTASAPPTPAGPLPNVPTLVIDGAADVRTPLEDAAKVQTLIPDAQLLRVPFTGHSALASDLSPEHCAVRAVGQFFTGQPVTPCAPSENPFSPTAVAPTKLASLKPTGTGGKVGRTITAAIATATDMRRQVIGDALEANQLPSRSGGLRGGRAVIRNGLLTLSRVIYVPGVEVSGSVPIKARGTQKLTITGTKAAHGTITVTPKSITGHLGGRRIKLVAGAASAVDADADPDYETLLRRFRLRTAGQP